MRRFMIATLSATHRRREAFHRHLYGGVGASWLMNTHKHRSCFSTHTNPLDNTISYNEVNIKGEEREANIRIKVISREHIKPSSPTPQSLRYYKLSIFDQIEPPIHHPLMFFYPNHTNDNNNNIEDLISDRSNHLKQSLSETLTRMYPFAGKLASELHFDCNDDGVYYIETRIDERLDNVLKKPDNKFLKRLLPFVDSVPNQPLSGSYASMIQVNFFKCGGVSITAQHNHKLADGRSSVMFMNTWAAVARKDRNQIYPNFVSSKMFPPNPDLPFAPYIPLWYLTICPTFLKYGKCETRRFVFNASALRKLKAKASVNQQQQQQPVSRVVAVLALLWKCVTTATQFKASALHVPVDIRQQLSPPLPRFSIGNIKSGTFVRLDPESTNLELASIASRLRSEIAEVKSESIEELRSENGHVRFVESLRNAMETFTGYEAEFYSTSSMCNSGSNEVDFGWGKPIWFCTGNQLNEDIPLFTNRMVLLDSCSGDGIEVWVTLEKHVMDAVKCNAELLSFASVDPSPLISSDV